MNQDNSKKKKIVYLITGSDTGGAEIVVKNLIFNLNQDEFLPIFVSIRPLGVIGREISEKFQTISLGAGKKFNPFFLLHFFYSFKKRETGYFALPSFSRQPRWKNYWQDGWSEIYNFDYPFR